MAVIKDDDSDGQSVTDSISTTPMDIDANEFISALSTPQETTEATSSGPPGAELTLNLLASSANDIDMNTLCHLMEKSYETVNLIEGKDVILLLGPTGCGKTTTSLYLAGVKFDEDDDGEFRPYHDEKSTLKNFTISDSSRSCTRHIQAIDVSVGGLNLAICDTPGFGDTEGLEYEIANGNGLIQAVHRAKSILPVVVMTKSCTDGRYQMLKDTLYNIARITGNNINRDFSSFNFVFTDCTKSDCKKLLRKLIKLKNELDADETHTTDPLTGLVAAMVSSLSMDAMYIDLSTEHTLVLDKIVKSSTRGTIQPSFFKPYVSTEAQDKLQQELQGIAVRVEREFLNNNFVEADKGVDMLIRFSNVFADYMTFLCGTLEMEEFSSRVAKHCLMLCKQICTLKNEQRALFLGEGEALTNAISVIRRISILNTQEGRNSVTAVDCMQTIGKLLNVEASSFDELDLKQVAWKLFQLEYFRQGFVDFEGNAIIERSFFDSFGRVNNILHTILTRIDQEVKKSPIEMKDRHYILFTITNFYNDLQANGVVEFLVERITFDTELVTLKKNLQNMIGTHIRGLVRAQDHFKHIAENKDVNSFSAAQFMQFGENRASLLWLAGPIETFETIFRRDKAKIERHIDLFDTSLVKCMHSIISIVESYWHELQIRMNENFEFSEIHQDALLVNDKLNEIRTFCEHARHWTDFDHFQIDDTWERTITLQATVKQGINELNEEVFRVERQIQQTIKMSYSFLSRLRSKRAKLHVILQELDQNQNWPSWTEIAGKDKKQSMLSWTSKLFKAGPSNREKLQVAMKKIVSAFKQIFSDLFVKLEFNISRAGDDCTKLIWILRGSADLIDLISPATLKKDSDLLRQIFCLDIARAWSNSISRCSSCFSFATKLFSTLCEDRNYLPMKEILQEWKKNIDTWRVVSSFACQPLPFIPLSNEEAVMKTFQKNLLLFPTLEDTVNSLHRSIERLKQDVDDFSWISLSESAKHHERLAYCHCIASLLSSSKEASWFEEYQSMDTKHTTHGLETYVLLKLSEEGSVLRNRLKTVMASFPSGQSNFASIQACLSTLACIETAFKETNQAIVRQATTFSTEAKDESKDLLAQYLRDIPSDTTILLGEMLLLKRASYEIPCWRNHVNENISAFLKRAISNEGKEGSLLLELSSLLHDVQECDMILAQQLLFEHSIFEGLKHAAFASSTKHQDISYVLRETNNLSEDSKCFLTEMYEMYDAEYRDIIERGLPYLGGKKGNAIETFYENLVTETKWVVEDSGLTYARQICILTAQIFAYWALSGSASYFECSGQLLKNPHPAQIMGVWLMLNIMHKDYINLENVLVELKTGEGKSIVLGVTATILGLLGCHVDCICYSKYLSDRDFEDFQHIFKRFGVATSICYGNLRTFAGNMLKGYWANAESVIWGKSLLKNESSLSNNPLPLRVLLVDEVDVFFGKDVLGEAFRPGANISNSKVKSLFHRVWNTCKNNSCFDNILLAEITSDFPGDSHKLIESMIFNLHIAASYVKEEIPTYVVQHDRIQYKYFDGLDSNIISATNSFRYIKEWELGNISKDQMDKQLCFAPLLGLLSFAELPHKYEKVLGVTGTLKGIHDSEQRVLKEKYSIKNLFFLPSVYGSNKLRFAGDSPEDVILCESESDFFLSLESEIRRRRKSPLNQGKVQRAVMVFFKAKKIMIDFFESPFMKALKKESQLISEEASKDEREGLFLKATESGAITLMIRDFGRGTDFKCYDQQMLQVGGVHVIQAFFSADAAEERQIKGRTARQGADGSYSMVINTEDLVGDLNISDDQIECMRNYRHRMSILKPIRDVFYQAIVANRCVQAEAMEEDHYKTFHFLELMNQGQKSDLILFVEKLNGVFGSNPCNMQSNNFKKEMIQRCKKRTDYFVFQDKQKRTKSKDEVLLLDCSARAKKKLNVRERVASTDRTYYSMLGVKTDASMYEISKAYRNLLYLFHHDKCKDTDATSLFQQLNEAKETLCCQVKRAVYDAKINTGDKVVAGILENTEL